jgi:protein-tyrosine-phosphatase
VARRRRLSLAQERPQPLDGLLRDGDYVVTVCDAAHEELAARGTARLHWSVPDPVRLGGPAAFERAVTEIKDRVARLAATVRPADAEPTRSRA